MAGPIRIAILANGTQAKREIGSVGSSVKGLGRTLKGGLAVAGVTGLTAGILGIGKSAVDAEKKYSTTMRLIQASTKASTGQMAALDKAAMRLGADTQFSAGEAADAMLELAKAGLDTKTILGGGVAGTLQLAAAGGTDLGTAATIASNALNTFNLQGRDMAKVAAALAGGANASSASVESLGQGLQQVGPGAVNAGLSLQETVAALSAFDAAGIKGSDAGTSLKTMLARLVPQTDKAQKAMEALGLDFVKGNGEFESLANIAGQLDKRLGGLSEAQRTVALNTIFGSDASRAASVLMKEGTSGVRRFVKATNDQSAAQKMANARMSGTEGALERLSGAVETAQLTLGKKLAPAVERGADLLADNLEPAMDRAIDGAKTFGRAVEPLARVLMDAGELAADAARFIDDLPVPLKETAIQAGIAALALPRLTGAATAAAGSLTLATAKVKQFNAELTYGATRSQAMRGALAPLGATAKNVAGVGGLMLLTSGLAEAKDEGANFGNVLKNAAGGAGIGAMFGPIGALVGAGAGAGLGALVGAFGETRQEAEKARIELLRTEGFKQAKGDAETLAEALQGVVNAYGRIPRAAVEASFTGEDGKLDSDVAKLRELGVSMDTIVSATMGRADAQKVVNKALADGLGTEERRAEAARVAYEGVRDGLRDVVTASGQVIKNGESLSSDEVDIYRKAWEDAKKPVDELRAAQDVFNERVSENTSVIGAHKRQMADLAEQLGITVGRYRQMPKAVRTRIESKGLPQTSRDALRLIGQYKGLQNFRTIKALVSAPGVQLTAGQIGKLQKAYKLTPKQVRTIFKLENVLKAEGEARRGGRAVKKAVEGEAGKAKADLGPFARSVTSGVGPAKSAGSSGGRQVGVALQQGVMAGFAGTQAMLANAAAAAVRAAVASAKAAGKIKSPSRETYYLGEMLGAGLELGFNSRTKGSEKSGRDAVLAMLTGVTKGSQGVDRAIGNITKLVERRIDKKNAKAERAAEKRTLKQLADQFNGLRKLGKAQDALASGNFLPFLKQGGKLFTAMTAAGVKNLDEARTKLVDLRQAATDYAAGIKGSFADFGNIVNLGQRDDGPRTLGTILEDLRKRGAEATEFRQLITSLQGAGLNETTVQQLLAAGPEAALSTVQAIQSGGGAAIAEINSLTQSIGTQGQALGDLMSEQFHGAGIRAAEGIVEGLESQGTQLDKAARKLAKALAKAVRDELGIKSPSRVFRQIGDNTVAGLGIGLDNTYVKRQGRVLARDLVGGFGTPTLDARAAYMTDPALAAAAGTTVQINVNVPPNANLVDVGRETQRALDSYYAAGGRRQQ